MTRPGRGGLTPSDGGRIETPVALCYRIAGHVKQAAKEVKGIGPGTFGPGFFLGRTANCGKTAR
jgi:hypothetical protein